MKYRTLGRTALDVSEIGYGAWGIGGNQWLGNNDDESLKALRHAFDLGLNFIDTALAYGDGHSERLVGKAVRDAGKDIYIATKIPPKDQVWPASPKTPIDKVFPYKYIIRCTDESLRNLKREQIDLQQFHVWTDAWTHTDEWKRAIEELKSSGKIRFMGISVSEHGPDTALEALQTGAIDAVQVIYNIFDQSPEKNLFPLCQKLNIGVLARVPLDEGGLTGTITPDTQFRTKRVPRALLPGRQETTDCRTRGSAQERSRGRSGDFSRNCSALLPVASGGDNGDSGHAAGKDRRQQLPCAGRRTPAVRCTGNFEASRLGPEFLRIAEIGLTDSDETGDSISYSIVW